jgi:hypothetical protein
MKVIAPRNQPTTTNLGHKLLKLCNPEYTYIIKHSGATFRLTFKEGYIFDGASIPRACWSALGVTPQMMEGEALAHDGGYQDRGSFAGNDLVTFEILVGDEFQPTDLKLPRSFWDELIKVLCDHFRGLDCGNVSYIKARLIWSAVSTFGVFAWKRDDWKRKKALRDSVVDEKDTFLNG